MINRRRFNIVTFAALAGTTALGRAVFARGALGGLADDFARIEKDGGGRLGIGVIDTGTGTSVGHRAYERFPMCSTFKILCAAAVLKRVDAGKEQLARRIPVTQADLLEYAPVTKQHLNGDMTVSELCNAMVTLSDNSAANLLLKSMGGPGSVTDLARDIGDNVSRLDRYEPALNTAIEGDDRDTTSPLAMARSVQALTIGSALARPSRDLLNDWMIGCKTGDSRLRAGLPKDWRVGDKTGTGENGTSNDAAVIWPTGHAPIIITAYLTQSDAGNDQRRTTFAAISKAVADVIGG